MISCIALELYFLEVSILMHSFINFGQRSCPVLAGHNLWHLFVSYVTIFIHTILYYAYYRITIPGRPANTMFYNCIVWQVPGAPLARSTSSRFLSVPFFPVKQPCTVWKWFDIYFTEFGTALTTILPILFQYCYKYCYSDSRNLWAVMKAGGLAL